MTIVTTLVTESADDGYQFWDDGMGDWDFDNGSNYVKMGSIGDGMGGAIDTTPYFRFLQVDIPQGANITSAKLQYKLYESWANSSSWATKIFGQLPESDCDSTEIDESEALQNALDELTDGTDVDGDGYTTWTPATSTDTTSYQDSADFTAVIQELVNRSCWKVAEEDVSSITIFLTDNTDADMMSGPYYMAIKSEDSGHPVKLVVEYSAAAAATANPAAFLLFVD